MNMITAGYITNAITGNDIIIIIVISPLKYTPKNWQNLSNVQIEHKKITYSDHSFELRYVCSNIIFGFGSSNHKYFSVRIQ